MKYYFLALLLNFSVGHAGFDELGKLFNNETKEEKLIKHKWTFKGFKYLDSQTEFDNTKSDTSLAIEREMYSENALNWIAVGVTDPDSANDWRKHKFIPTEIQKWLNIDIGPNEARNWEQINYNPIMAKEWSSIGFNALSARQWIESSIPISLAKEFDKRGFTAKIALPWYHAKIDPETAAIFAQRKINIKNPTLVKSWLDHGFDNKTTILAIHYDLTQEDIKGFEKVPPNIIALAKHNNLTVNELIKLYEYSEKKCPTSFDDLDPEINPFDLLGKCYSIDVDFFQLLGEKSALYKSKTYPDMILRIDFIKESAKMESLSVVGKGKKPFQYTSALGTKNIIPWFSVIFALELSDELIWKIENEPEL